MSLLLEFLNCGIVPTWWAELCIMLSFLLGLMIFRSGGYERPEVSVRKNSFKEAQMLCGSIEAAAGRNDEVVAMWSAAQHYAPTPIGTLRLVVEAFLATEPEDLVDALVEHMEEHANTFCNPAAAAEVLDAVARTGQIEMVEELLAAFRSRLRLTPGPQACEALLAAYSATGTPQQVTECMARIRADGQEVTVRAHALVIRGLLERGMLDSALAQALQMHSEGFKVPPQAIAEIVRVACEAGRAAELVDGGSLNSLGLTSDAVQRLLIHCTDSCNHDLAHRVEQLANAVGVPLCSRAYTALVKLSAANGDPHTLELLDEMQRAGCCLAEGFHDSIAALSTDAGFHPLAVEVKKMAHEHLGPPPDPREPPP